MKYLNTLFISILIILATICSYQIYDGYKNVLNISNCLKMSCKNISCDEAKACLLENPELDADKDGIPCENICK